MAFIRVPAAMMRQASGWAVDAPPDGPLGSGELGLGVIGILNRENVLARLTGHAKGIEGTLDASGDDFEWRGPRMQVRGRTFRGDDDVTLMLSATEGGNEMETIVSVAPGSVIFLHSSNPDPEGVLIVIGKNEPGDYPAGDWDDG